MQLFLLNQINNRKIFSGGVREREREGAEFFTRRKKKIALSNLKAFTRNLLNIIQNIKLVFNRIENIVGKGENAGHQHFLFFPKCFQKALSSEAFKAIV